MNPVNLWKSESVFKVYIFERNGQICCMYFRSGIFKDMYPNLEGDIGSEHILQNIFKY